MNMDNDRRVKTGTRKRLAVAAKATATWLAMECLLPFFAGLVVMVTCPIWLILGACDDSEPTPYTLPDLPRPKLTNDSSASGDDGCRPGRFRRSGGHNV